MSEILDNDFEVLEIGSGPGTLTIPLAKKVKKVVAVESSEMAVDYLKRNIKESRVENVEIMNKKTEAEEEEEEEEKGLGKPNSFM